MVLVIVLAVIGLGWLWYSRLSFGSATESQRGGQLTSRLSLALFVLMITLAQVVHLRRPVPTDLETPKITCRAWITGVAAALFGIAGLIVYVDPRGLYGTGIYEPRELSIRGDKITAYDQLTETPDVIVLGSSRAFTILPEFFEQDFGYSAFNMSVEGAGMEDYVIQTTYILEHDSENPPKVLLIEITPPLPDMASNVISRSPFKLIPYMDNELKKLAIQTKLEGLLDPQQLNQAIYSLRYFMTHPEPPESWTFGPDGGGSHPPQEHIEAAVWADTKSINPPRCPRAQLDPTGSRRLEQVIEMAEKHHISLVFVITPRHPDYFNQLMAGTPQFRRCQKAMHTYMDDLTRRYPFVFFLDYTRLKDIDGVADATGYYDSQHITAVNSHLIVRAAADTIRQAYDVARSARTQH
jgi:hypothetical protein